MRRLSFNHENAKKVIFLGNTGIGKTARAVRWVRGSYDEGIVPTIGAAHASKDIEVGQTIVKITLWDTAWQEQYRTIAPLYVRGSRVAIIVASIDLIDSFHSIPAWLELLTQPEEIPITAFALCSVYRQ
jgi:small GTP-binding protein